MSTVFDLLPGETEKRLRVEFGFRSWFGPLGWANMCANFSFGVQADCQIPPRWRLEWRREDELRAEAQGHGAVDCVVLSAERDQRPLQQIESLQTSGRSENFA
jgi:hypothetical protein